MDCVAEYQALMRISTLYAQAGRDVQDKQAEYERLRTLSNEALVALGIAGAAALGPAGMLAALTGLAGGATTAQLASIGPLQGAIAEYTDATKVLDESKDAYLKASKAYDDCVQRTNTERAQAADQKAQMDALLQVAADDSRGKAPDHNCYAHVAQYLKDVNRYGSFGGGRFDDLVPSGYWEYAHMFADYLNAADHCASLGLQRLAVDNPYDAPAGAIVVVRAGTPGTADPTAGDIAIADGKGNFYNGGEMGYGGSGNFPAGNDYVLGVYVPVGVAGNK